MKKQLQIVIFTLSALLLSSSLFAQFGALTDISDTDNPFRIDAFDLDIDGDLDILSLNGDKLVWYENLGNGNYSKQQFILFNHIDRMVDFLIEDMDGDGIKDFVICFTHEIVWHKNLGGGHIGSSTLLINTSLFSAISTFELTDLENDGYIDIVYRDSYYGVFLSKNIGGNVFDPPIKLNACNCNPGPFRIYSEDIDGDGLEEIFTTILKDDFLEHELLMFKNLSNGILDTARVIEHDVVPGGLSVSFYDLDLDGDKDIITNAPRNSSNMYMINWYENLGSGNIDTNYQILYLTTQKQPFEMFDIDNDGLKDIVTNYSNNYYWLKNNGNATMSQTQNIIDNNVSIMITSLGAPQPLYIDTDNDGLKDLLGVDNLTGRLFWYKKLASGFDLNRNFLSSGMYRPTTKLADIDNDGDEDIIFNSQYYNGAVPQEVLGIGVIKNLGNGLFSTPEYIFNEVIKISELEPIDVDNDGDNDILFFGSSLGQGFIAWLDNLGGGNFDTTLHVVYNLPTTSNVDFSKFIDYNNDGNVDILFDGISTGLFMIENLGGGVFDTTIQYVFSAGLDINPPYLYIDIDNDNDFDVVGEKNTGINGLVWVENILGNIGTTLNNITTGNNPLWFSPNKIGDVDDDGDLDLYGCNTTNLYWYENLGNSMFSSMHMIDSNLAYSQHETLKDIDGDGDNDLIVSSFISNAHVLTMYEKSSSGNFMAPVTISVPVNLDVLDFFDADQDGDQDALFDFSGNSIIAWSENYFTGQYKLKGEIFLDFNNNGQKDTSEGVMPFSKTSVQPNALSSFTNSQGKYFHATDTGTYTISCEVPDSLWGLTTDSVTYTRTLTSANPVIDSLNFGFYPDSILTIIKPTLTGGFPRCNQIINYWANIRNQGTTLPSGIVHLQLDDSIAYISATFAPDSIVGQNIYWHYDSLFFYSEKNFNIQVQMPPFTSMGNLLSSILTVDELDANNNVIYTNINTLNQVSVCAYDPNDKSVLPKGVGPEGYIKNEQELEYLIRFQNTGNDTAITVMVRDQLDANLDWSSLQPIASSHPMQVWIEQDGEAVFKFGNIMLPDSNVNELASHGFVKFKISPKPNLPHSTPMFNTGHIYFDNNPAVITNTILNTIDTISPIISVNEITFTETNEVIVFPNPFKNRVTVYYKGKIEGAYTLVVYDITGKEMLKKEQLTANKTVLELNQLKQGIYIVVATDNTGKRLFSERIIAQ